MLIRKPLIFFTVLIAIVALFAVTPAVADGDPCVNQTCKNSYPYNITSFFPVDEDSAGFLGNETCDFFNPVGGPVLGEETNEGVCNTTPSFDPTNPGGIWEVTVIGNEAGNHLQLMLTTPMGEGVDEEVLFDKPAYATDGNDECDNYGEWKKVNFDAGQFLKFKDLTITKVSTIPWSPESDDFQWCELNQGTNAFTHLENVINGDKGYVAIGWDNGGPPGGQDYDYTDLIVLMRKFPCEPAGAVVYQACVNYFGDENNKKDDVSFDVIRRGDEKGCIESLRACVGTGCTDGCLDIDPGDLPGGYVSSGALSGQTCANENVNVKTGSPYYLYEVVSGGYVFRGCLNLNQESSAGPYWETSLNPCLH